MLSPNLGKCIVQDIVVKRLRNGGNVVVVQTAEASDIEGRDPSLHVVYSLQARVRNDVLVGRFGMPLLIVLTKPDSQRVHRRGAEQVSPPTLVIVAIQVDELS